VKSPVWWPVFIVIGVTILGILALAFQQAECSRRGGVLVKSLVGYTCAAAPPELGR
jgi:hypothetical protein